MPPPPKGTLEIMGPARIKGARGGCCSKEGDMQRKKLVGFNPYSRTGLSLMSARGHPVHDAFAMSGNMWTDQA